MKTKVDPYLFVAVILMIIGFILILWHYSTEVNECTEDPLKYSLKDIEEFSDAELVEVRFYKDRNDLFPIKTKSFNLK